MTAPAATGSMPATCDPAEVVAEAIPQATEPLAPPAIALRGVRKAFGAVNAVGGVDLDVEQGRLTAIVGPSGCGKTTLLRLVAGFERPDGGTISIGGQTVAGDRSFAGPEQRRAGMVFQDFALFPHLDVSGNVGYALGRRPDRRRVEEMLELVGLDGLGARRPHELSGGQQQRVALARALVAQPAVVLLDEPFSNLDAGRRVQMRRELRRILDATGVSGLLVTHDQGEALSLADRVAIMRAGRVEQVGSPQEVYMRPASRWAAEFLGEVNVLPGTASGGMVETPLGTLPDDARHLGDVDVLLRPEHLALAAAAEIAPGDGRPATVVACEYFGHDQIVTVALDDGTPLRHRCLGHSARRVGDQVVVRVDGPASVMAAGSRIP